MSHPVDECVKAIREEGLDAILVSHPVNISYLTRFRADADGYLLLTRQKEMFYFTNPLYAREAERLAVWRVVTVKNNIFNSVAAVVKRLRMKKVGFESKHLPFLEYKTMRDKMDLFPTRDLVISTRAVKTAAEIKQIRRAAQITQEALDFIEQIRNPQMTEKHLSIEVERFLRIKGDDETAFKTIVAAAGNSSLPHHLSSCKKSLEGFFLTDLGAKHYGYCADLTRIFFWGKMPPLLNKITDIVRRACDIGTSYARSGIKACRLDKKVREFIEKKGYGKYFTHGLGHGLGLEVHEPPYINPYNEQVLKEGMVVTIEPAIYLRSKFGVRLEDMILVKKDKGEILNGNTYRKYKGF